MRRYRLADWTSSASPPEEEWLARWIAGGWRLEFDDGVWVEIGGHRIKRFALVRDDEPDQGRD